jgi:hypothetical protein
VSIEAQLVEILEKLSRPGLLGAVGRKIEKRCAKDLAGYFKQLRPAVLKLGLEGLKGSKDEVKHAVDMKLHRVLAGMRPLLVSALATNAMEAWLASYKMDFLREAEGDQSGTVVGDHLGDSGRRAAKYAASTAATKVQGIDETTRQIIADAVSAGIEDELGVPGTARLIRSALDGMETARAALIATTEMADAMSSAAIDKMSDSGIEYKQIILSDDACPICVANSEEDPVPLDHVYGSGDSEPSFHPNCRCAITGARAPEES